MLPAPEPVDAVEPPPAPPDDELVDEPPPPGDEPVDEAPPPVALDPAPPMPFSPMFDDVLQAAATRASAPVKRSVERIMRISPLNEPSFREVRSLLARDRSSPSRKRPDFMRRLSGPAARRTS
jgi:hypothetical protein